MNMKHVFQPGAEDAPTLLLLHGTGGNEHDLLPLAQVIDPSAAVLSVRGNVLERGMPRFFRRLAEGVFDEEDLVFRTHELHAFVNDAAETTGSIAATWSPSATPTAPTSRPACCFTFRGRCGPPCSTTPWCPAGASNCRT